MGHRNVKAFPDFNMFFIMNIFLFVVILCHIFKSFLP
jgi:hypothetical protein